jgi:hypothetical protein
MESLSSTHKVRMEMRTRRVRVDGRVGFDQEQLGHAQLTCSGPCLKAVSGIPYHALGVDRVIIRCTPPFELIAGQNSTTDEMIY